MKKQWEVELFEGKNPKHTGSFLNSYDEESFTQEEITARESAQNSMDAGTNEKIVEMEFHDLATSGKKKKEFLNLFNFEGLLRPRIPSFKENKKNEGFADNVITFLEEDNLDALLIRDFNTSGLGGDWRKYTTGNHFARLVYASSLDDKADDDTNSGGSFGLGKTVYSGSSMINTVIYHSVFKPTEETKKVSRRLSVAGVYPKHDINDKTYGGFAYFGPPDPKNSNEVMPFEDNDAEYIWNQIGDAFGSENMTRKDNQYGTDVLILAHTLEINNITKAIEDYYFPATTSGKLSVKLYDQDGNRSVPKPLERNDLDQFIRLVNDAKSDIKEKSTEKEVDFLRKSQDHRIGKFAFEKAEEDEAKSAKNNCIAFLRGTEMVRSYLKLGSDRYEPAVGAFVADKDMWPYLIASENAAHSRWNEGKRKLKNQFGLPGASLVKTLNVQVKDKFSKFQKNLQPPVETSRSVSGLLGRLLSQALSGGSGDDPPPPGDPNPVAISLQLRHRKNDVSIWKLRLTSNENTHETNPHKLIIQPSVSIAGDNMTPVKKKEITLKDANGQILAQGNKPEHEIVYNNKDTVDMTVEFRDPGAYDYVVRTRIIWVKEE